MERCIYNMEKSCAKLALLSRSSCPMERWLQSALHEKDPSITPAVAPAGAAPSSTSSSTKHQTNSSTKHSDVQAPSKTVLGTRPERGSERGANEVRTRSEGDPQSFTNFIAYPAEETRESSLTSTYTLHVKENGWNDDINNHIAQPHHITSSHITSDKNRT